CSRVSLSFFCTCPLRSAMYPLSLHDALPISVGADVSDRRYPRQGSPVSGPRVNAAGRLRDSIRVEGAPAPELRLRRRPLTPFASDRKSTRLNSSHVKISYAVFCLKKKKNTYT